MHLESCVCVSDLQKFLKLVSGSSTFFVVTPTTAQSCFLRLHLLSKPSASYVVQAFMASKSSDYEEIIIIISS